MGKHVNSKSRTFRLPTVLLDRMEEEASASDMSMNELAKRRLWTSFFGARKSQKVAKLDHEVTGVFDE